MSDKPLPKPISNEEEETKQVIKVMSQAGTALVFVASICALVGIVMPWWFNSSALLEVGLNGTERTISADVSLWDFDLHLELAPAAGEIVGKEMHLQTTWDAMCITAAATLPSGPPATCGTVVLARLFIVLSALLSSVAAVFVILAKRFTPLLLLGGVAGSFLATFFTGAAAFMGVMMSTSGLNGWGFLFTGGAMVLNGLGVAAIFYAATKAMPPPDSEAEAGRGSRLRRAQDATKKAEEMAKQLEMGMAARKKPDRQKLGETDDAPASEKKKHVMLKRVIFWQEEAEEGEELPMELLEAAYQEIDEDGSGSVTMEELVGSLNDCGLHASQTAADNVMKEIDKNMDGTIDIHEFVEFFRTLEEMDEFQKKTEARAQFLTFICNFCFLSHIVIVGVFLMIFIRMDEADNPDNYSIMQTMLMAFSVVLALLFMSVIAIPAARMTLGPQLVAWQYHYFKAMKPPAKVQNQNQTSVSSAAQGLRGAAWTEGAGEAPPVNAAKYGASYRVSRMSYDMSADNYQQGNQRALTAGTSDSGRQYTAGSHSTPQTGQIPGAPPGAIMSKTGEFMRYNPTSYRDAAMSSKVARMPMSFTPMQVQNLGTSSDDPDQIAGMMAIGNGDMGGTSFYNTR
mmetsp:Transcript_81367/g.143607  ORF Transcript_81367/g.143607 Transcript_81367/m.143607 type:complete len:626 (-) Transcript_81367:97-1974(-)